MVHGDITLMKNNIEGNLETLTSRLGKKTHQRLSIKKTNRSRLVLITLKVKQNLYKSIPDNNCGAVTNI